MPDNRMRGAQICMVLCFPIGYNWAGLGSCSKADYLDIRRNFLAEIQTTDLSGRPFPKHVGVRNGK